MLLNELLQIGLSKTPHKTAVICGEKRLTHGELDAAADSYAALFAAHGAAKGDRVALFMKNSVDMAALYLACFRSGVIAVPLNVRYTAYQAEYSMTFTGVRLVFTDKGLCPVLEKALPSCPGVEAVYIMGEKGPRLLQGAGPQAAQPAPVFTPTREEPAVILFTSGSTGRPKGVIHSQGGLGRHLEHKIAGQCLQQDEVGIVGTQISHVGGLAGVLLPTLAVGGACVMIEAFEPEEYIRLLHKYKPTFLMLLPTQLLEVLEHPHAKDADFSHIRSGLVGGDIVPHHVYELYRSLVGEDLMEGCGMTECEGYCLQPRDEPKKPGSIGKPVPGVRLRLVDRHGQDAPPGKVGEILLKSDSMFTGYWDNPDEEAKALTNGWLHTGDLARCDEDGFYYYIGRIKELIIRGGSNISPMEVEEVLDDCPLVEVSGVVGFPDEHWGQVVGAFIEPAPGCSPTREELGAYAAKELAKYMVPEHWVFVDKLPRNAVGKVDRHALHLLAAKPEGEDSA